MVDVEAPGDARALSPASSRFRPSVRCLSVSFGFLRNFYASSLGNGTTVVGPANYALTLILGERAQEGDEAPADWGRQVQVRLIEDFGQRTPLVLRRHRYRLGSQLKDKHFRR